MPRPMRASGPLLDRRRFLAALAAAPLLAQGAEKTVMTVRGPVPATQLGVTLMHEHVIADLRPLPERRLEDYDRDAAIEACYPHLRDVRALGAMTLVEPTPLHIGRDLEALRALSERADIRIVGATGIYGAANQSFIPRYAFEEPAEKLAERYLREIEDGVGPSRIRPGLIKTGVNRETPLPDIERKLVRAAALAGKQSGLTVAAHTGPAAPAREELRILQEAGLPEDRFIWVHAQNEDTHAARIELAKEGIWVELDGISPRSAEKHLDAVKAMADAGQLHRTLLSQDAGWYRPGPEGASKYRDYGFLLHTFVPMLREAGFFAKEIDQLLVDNPARALAG
ncbi:MAG: phosphotriesterase [Acidobacteria bacterium]|nr:phosphotriesterase [Acidobacteriota bacterium]